MHQEAPDEVVAALPSMAAITPKAGMVLHCGKWSEGPQH